MKYSLDIIDYFVNDDKDVYAITENINSIIVTNKYHFGF